MTIDHSSFGWIEIDGQRFNHDVLVHQDGRVTQRLGSDSHTLDTAEARQLTGGRTGYFVVGTGHFGRLHLTPGALKLLEERGVRLFQDRTGKAIQTFNLLDGPKCGLFHVTC